MNKTYTTIIVLILVVVGLFFIFRSKTLEAPAKLNDISGEKEMGDSVYPISNTMPVPDADSEVKEMVVSEVKEFTVTGKNFSFSPSLITVKKGDKVKITFQNSEGFHDFVIDEFGAATKQTKAPTTEVIEFTADKVGSFEYYCSVGTHRAMGMKGVLKVE
jgi:nitrosocyanin